MEAGLAQVSASIFNAARMTKQGGGQFEPADFMPWAGERKEQDLDAMILTWARSEADGR